MKRVKELNRFEGLSYEELLNELGKNHYRGKEALMLHRELKKYGDGLPLMYRYPDLPSLIGVMVLVIGIVAVVYIIATMW